MSDKDGGDTETRMVHFRPSMWSRGDRYDWARGLEVPPANNNPRPNVARMMDNILLPGEQCRGRQKRMAKRLYVADCD